ncbi:MAG: CGNR zinc finger domain-containing protein [Longimicrobiales bacterium]|nr:CGNR zinc finger domain-containing protein [Longimicrobiales bacterium]
MDTLIRKSVLERFGNLALDLTNTVICERTGPVDVIQKPDQFIEWLSEMEAPGCPELIPDSPPGRKTLFVEAHRLRADLHHLFNAFTSGKALPDAVVFNVNRALRRSRRASRLTVVDGLPVLREHQEADAPLAVLAPIALAGATLVADADRRRLRQCAGTECTRWFLDTSKGGRRQWCSMATCGNRAKSARFRARADIG